jgi:hypothetical protein
MAQPKVAPITCRECDSFYTSENEFQKHMQEVHRRSVSEQSTLRLGGISKEEWASLSVHLRNHVQVRFKSEELDAIDRFILLGSQGSFFDKV